MWIVLYYLLLFYSDFIIRRMRVAPLLHADFLNLPSSFDHDTELSQKISSSRCHRFLFSPPSGRCDDGLRRTFIPGQVCQRITYAYS